MALIRKLPLEPKINFVGRRKLFMGLSGLIVLVSLGLFFTQGLNFGIDFKGGIVFEVRTDGPADIAAMRDELGQLNLGDLVIQEFGAEDEVLITASVPEGGDAAQAAVKDAVNEALADEVEEWRRQEFVGPKVGDELRQAGILATLLSLAGIALYIWFRFEWQFAAAALLALVHDIIATIGFFALTGIEFNLATLAAVLTIAGYSINDTVVIFDRVREEFRRYKKMPATEVLNMSINRTLSRTTLTALTTLLALAALSVFGGEVIRGFSLGLIWGVTIGTYSSIAVAVPLLMLFGIKRGHIVTKEEDEGDEAKASA